MDWDLSERRRRNDPARLILQFYAHVVCFSFPFQPVSEVFGFDLDQLGSSSDFASNHPVDCLFLWTEVLVWQGFFVLRARAWVIQISEEKHVR